MSHRADTASSRRGERSLDPGRGMRLELDAPIGCGVGELGRLADVVIDPDSGHVTHLVVEPHRPEVVGPRLVPIALAEPHGLAGLMLRCTLREFDALEPVRRFASVPLSSPNVSDPEWDIGKIDVVAPAMPIPIEAGTIGYPIDSTVAYDRVPKYEIELGRTSPVRSSDGHHLGHVVALTVDDKGLLTGFVLSRRRLWMHRHVAVPVAAVEQMGTDLVKLSLSRREAGRLPTERVPLG